VAAISADWYWQLQVVGAKEIWRWNIAAERLLQSNSKISIGILQKFSDESQDALLVGCRGVGEERGNIKLK
jgi:hypothetical protein